MWSVSVNSKPSTFSIHHEEVDNQLALTLASCVASVSPLSIRIELSVLPVFHPCILAWASILVVVIVLEHGVFRAEKRKDLQGRPA